MPQIKRGPRSKMCEAGRRFQEIVLNWGGSLKAFYVELSKALGTSPETIEPKISNFINGHKDYPSKYILHTERILKIRIADVVDGNDAGVVAPAKPGLYEVGTHGKYGDFVQLSKETDGSVEVIRSYDEWSKSIFDYVYEARNLDGLRFLVDQGFYSIHAPGDIMAAFYQPVSAEQHAVILLGILSKDKDPDFTLFKKLFDTRDHTDLVETKDGIFENECVLRAILDNESLLSAVCRKPELVPESRLNGPHRIIFEEEFHALCASNWLTPCLCFALSHEDEYKRQANQLLDFSLYVANQTLTRIGENLRSLGGEEESITTKNGHVLLGHSYVIGVVGEPSTASPIKDGELAKKASAVTARIGGFRAMAKFQTPVRVGKTMHLPYAKDNALYKEFVKLAVGHPYLLQKVENKEGDSSNLVVKNPVGEGSSGNLSCEQWRQFGFALKSIHGIDTGTPGTSFCHGRFSYPDIFIKPNGEVELIYGYWNVYIGNPEDDVLAALLLAYNANGRQENEGKSAIEAFLSGYGYPTEGILEKLFNYLIASAQKAKNSGEARYYMNAATNLLSKAKAKD